MPTMTQAQINSEGLKLAEKLIQVRRVAKVVKGGKRMRFSALVVVGDGDGNVGLGMGKASEVPDAIRKANYYGKKNLLAVPLVGTTIPHQITAKFKAAKVFLKPAAPGTGVIAAGSVRAVLEAAGIRDVLTKSLGSDNPINVAQATMLALSQLRTPREAIAARMGTATEANHG